MRPINAVTTKALIKRGINTKLGQVVTKVVTTIPANTRHLWTDLPPPYRGEDVQMMCFK
jgi:hypothetical protein